MQSATQSQHHRFLQGVSGTAVVATFIVAGALIAGCSEATRISTTPPGAMVRINGRELGEAPVKLKVKSWDVQPNAFHYQVEKPGYAPKEGYIEPHLSVSRIIAAALSSCFTCSFHGFFQFDEDTEIVLQPETPAPQLAGADDPAAVRLHRLRELHDQGLISADEFQQYKAEVLRNVVDSAPPNNTGNAPAPPMPDLVREGIMPFLNALPRPR